jgi:hypothetical protein
MKLLFAILAVLFFASTANADWVRPGYGGWGTYRYWGPYNGGRPGGYYNYGQYRWNGMRAWRYSNPYGR